MAAAQELCDMRSLHLLGILVSLEVQVTFSFVLNMWLIY
jgi:hypothetical protein